LRILQLAPVDPSQEEFIQSLLKTFVNSYPLSLATAEYIPVKLVANVLCSGARSEISVSQLMFFAVNLGSSISLSFCLTNPINSIIHHLKSNIKGGRQLQLSNQTPLQYNHATDLRQDIILRLGARSGGRDHLGIGGARFGQRGYEGVAVSMSYDILFDVRLLWM